MAVALKQDLSNNAAHQQVVDAVLDCVQELIVKKPKLKSTLGVMMDRDRTGKAIALLTNEDHLLGLFKADGSAKTSGLSDNDDLQELSNITNEVTARVKARDHDTKKIKTPEELEKQKQATTLKMSSRVVDQNFNHYNAMYADSVWLNECMEAIKDVTGKAMRKPTEDLTPAEENLKDAWTQQLQGMTLSSKYANAKWEKQGITAERLTAN